VPSPGRVGRGATGQANSKSRGMMLPVRREKPSVNDWLMAWRSRAWFTASRTRRSAHGDFGSHLSVKASHCSPKKRMGLSVRPAARRTSSAMGPRKT